MCYIQYNVICASNTLSSVSVILPTILCSVAMSCPSLIDLICICASPRCYIQPYYKKRAHVQYAVCEREWQLVNS